MTDKPSREDVLRVAKECGFKFNPYGCIVADDDREICGDELERFAAAMYAAGAEEMRERAAKACDQLPNYYRPSRCGLEIRALPITTNTEGEQA